MEGLSLRGTHVYRPEPARQDRPGLADMGWYSPALIAFVELINKGLCAHHERGGFWLFKNRDYAGAMLVYLATPLFLDSALAFLPTLFNLGLYLLRIALEDRFLQDELEGYRDYTKRVRYRLFPGIW